MFTVTIKRLQKSIVSTLINVSLENAASRYGAQLINDGKIIMRFKSIVVVHYSQHKRMIVRENGKNQSNKSKWLCAHLIVEEYPRERG